MAAFSPIETIACNEPSGAGKLHERFYTIILQKPTPY
jgi:hypothetical protein